MVSILDYLTQGTRIFLTSWKNRISPKKYEGNAETICKQIVKDCWNDRFFQTSTTNFPQFWTRDFGWCTKSLLTLKYEKEVHQTLRYAINRFKEYKKITTTITPKGKPFDFPLPAVDSLPWLIHSIKISKFPHHSHKNFLNQETKKFFKTFINEHTGLVKPDLHVSSMKDFAVRKSSCYDNCMVALLAKDLEEMKLINPFKGFNYPDIIKRHFWNGAYFYDDLTKKDYITGDANFFPFIFGVVEDKKMLHSAIAHLHEAELDEPFPLKYSNSRENINFIWQELFFRDYESNAIWMHMGPLYVKLLQQVDENRSRKYKEKYKELIEKHKNFLEVFSAAGKPFSTPFYYCDSGMLWAANYLTL
ncbi:MAG: hypothetical protein ABH824_05100 [Nanoarchaeota archaeon]|nr:hypothetical protein [Nanoarchaeota archaeon]MBU1632457.1 hypothetical protein [Nanoarchaeota archaeon]MBU1876470.1 hypothetical protein [Nanoarchaeota archaeon]